MPFTLAIELSLPIRGTQAYPILLLTIGFIYEV